MVINQLGELPPLVEGERHAADAEAGDEAADGDAER